jgi:hypothetical protein
MPDDRRDIVPPIFHGAQGISRDNLGSFTLSTHAAAIILTQINRQSHCWRYRLSGEGCSSTHAETDEGFEMFRHKELRSSGGRSLVLATIAVLALTLAEPPMAAAHSSGRVAKGVAATVPAHGVTDVSARRRHHHHYRGGNAAGLAMMGMMFGTIAAIAAQQREDEYYDYGPGYYGYGPGYYAGPPVYYGYGPHYYGHHFHRFHRW